MRILELKNISKRYSEATVLNNVNIKIDSGKIYLIKGRSGCGKSTLLNICSFLELPDSGSIWYKSNLTASMDEKAKKEILRNEIGYIFQEYNLFEDLSAYDNLFIYLSATSYLSKCEMEQRIQNVLSHMGLLHKSNCKAKFLSGGERQRLTLARALLLPRSIIYADEPSANMDTESIDIMIELFLQLCGQGTSILVVSHDNTFDSIADVKLVLENGELK